MRRWGRMADHKLNRHELVVRLAHWEGEPITAKEAEVLKLAFMVVNSLEVHGANQNWYLNEYFLRDFNRALQEAGGEDAFMSAAEEDGDVFLRTVE